MIFVSVPFQLKTAQAERISVEHVVKATPTEGIASVDLHIGAVSTSLNALVNRLGVIRRFLEFTKASKVPPDYRLLRQVSHLCSQLPAAASDEFKKDFLNEYNDTLVVTYLACVTKLTDSLHDLVDKFKVAHADRHRPRGM